MFLSQKLEKNFLIALDSKLMGLAQLILEKSKIPFLIFNFELIIKSIEININNIIGLNQAFKHLRN